MTYSLYVSSVSPHSFKAAACLGYAGLPCEVRRENLVNRYAVLKRLTGSTRVPVLRQGDWVVGDSSRIARWAARHSERPFVPEEAGLASICWLLEEFADEWVGRWVAFERWSNEENAAHLRRTIGDELVCGVPLAGRPIGRVTEAVLRRELQRAGVAATNQRALRQSRDRTLQALENHLEGSCGYLFGDAPTVADFGLYGPLEQYRRSPTGGERMELYPAITEWLEGIDRMRLPHPVVPIRHGTSFDPRSLRPLLAEFFGSFWRVASAAHRARHREAAGPVEVELLDGASFRFSEAARFAERVESMLRRFDQLFRAGGREDESLALSVEQAVEDALERLARHLGGREAIRAFDELADRI